MSDAPDADRSTVIPEIRFIRPRGRLLMAVAIPEGFGAWALLFAASYVALQIARNAFVVLMTPPGAFNQNFRQILTWSVFSAPLWIAGGVVDEARWPLWLAALGVDLAAPLVRYWLPGDGSTPLRQWRYPVATSPSGSSCSSSSRSARAS